MCRAAACDLPACVCTYFAPACRRLLVLKCALELNHARPAREVVQDLHLALVDGLVRELLARGLVCAHNNVTPNCPHPSSMPTANNVGALKDHPWATPTCRRWLLGAWELHFW
jgi:hypothetical protein